MSELTDRELFRVRLRSLDLLKSFYLQEPDAERMSRWRGIFSALAREQINPCVDVSIRECGNLLNTLRLQDLQQEYYRLFADPFGTDRVNTTASFYLDGHSYGQTLVSLRSFLDEVGLAKFAGIKESEDALVILLDTLATLVEDEKETGSRQIRIHQTKLLEEYILPFACRFRRAVEANAHAVFYGACSRFLCGCLDLEKGLSGEN